MTTVTNPAHIALAALINADNAAVMMLAHAAPTTVIILPMTDNAAPIIVPILPMTVPDVDLIISHAPDQSPFMIANTVLMLPEIAVIALETSVLMIVHAEFITVCISIGNVASDMTERMAKGVAQADGTIKAEPRMDMSAVVETFLTMSRLPLSANILFTTVMATNMPYVGRG